MTTTAFDDQFVAAPEPVRQPYDTASILRRNVAELELALKRQTERAESAEAELAQARQQKPVRWHVRGNYFHDGDAAILFASMNSMCGAKVEQLFAAPVPVPHKGATHCDDCGLTWLDDGLNPLRCPYCKDTVPAPAVPYGIDEEAANRIALAVYDCKHGINQEPLLYAINRILATEAHPLSAEGQRSLLQSAEGSNAAADRLLEGGK